METTRHSSRNSTDAGDKMSGEIEALKSGFSQLRGDVVDLISHAFGVGRSGAQMARTSANDTVEDLKSKLGDLRERGADRLSALEHKIEEKPLQSALIAFGVGFLLARFLTPRR